MFDDNFVDFKSIQIPANLKLDQSDSSLISSNIMLNKANETSSLNSESSDLNVDYLNDERSISSTSSSAASGKVEHCSSPLLKPPAFFKTNRRRSKTYSGEEFAAHFDKLNQVNTDPKSQDNVSDLPKKSHLKSEKNHFNNITNCNRR